MFWILFLREEIIKKMAIIIWACGKRKSADLAINWIAHGVYQLIFQSNTPWKKMRMKHEKNAQLYHRLMLIPAYSFASLCFFSIHLLDQYWSIRLMTIIQFFRARLHFILNEYIFSILQSNVSYTRFLLSQSHQSFGIFDAKAKHNLYAYQCFHFNP